MLETSWSPILTPMFQPAASGFDALGWDHVVD